MLRLPIRARAVFLDSKRVPRRSGRLVFALAFVLALSFAPPALAAAAAASSSGKAETEARFFGAMHTVDPGLVNAQMRADGISSYSSVPGLGVEAGQRFWSVFSFNARYEARYQRMDVHSSSTSTGGTNPYFSALRQTTLEAVLRFIPVETSILRFEVFGGAGFADTNLDVRSSGGEVTYKQSGGIVSKAGAAIALGYSNVFFFAEGGIETNDVDGLTKAGNTSSTIRTIDLSGPYVAAGLLFSGSPSFLKTK